MWWRLYKCMHLSKLAELHTEWMHFAVCTFYHHHHHHRCRREYPEQQSPPIIMHSTSRAVCLNIPIFFALFLLPSLSSASAVYWYLWHFNLGPQWLPSIGLGSTLVKQNWSSLSWFPGSTLYTTGYYLIKEKHMIRFQYVRRQYVIESEENEDKDIDR